MVPPKGEPRGVALFLHGFTACPMQFLPFAEKMSEAGYYALIPLLPGQGRAPTPMAGDQVFYKGKKVRNLAAHYGQFLPREAKDYDDFLAKFNLLVSRVQGQRVVAGLSVGGAMATQAIVVAREQGLADLYHRSLAISPYYGMPGLYLGRRDSDSVQGALANLLARPVGDTVYHAQKALLIVAEKMGLMGEIPVSFGKMCYASICGDRSDICPQYATPLQVKGGRDAICDFKLANIAALEHNGDSIRSRFMRMLEEGGSSTRHQIIGVEFDTSTDTAHILQLGEALIKSHPDQGRYCLYPSYKGQKVGHVIFDLTEQPFAAMPWRDAFMRESLDFLIKGTFFRERNLKPGQVNCVFDD
jgi:dienelactone hydrolase